MKRLLVIIGFSAFMIYLSSCEKCTTCVTTFNAGTADSTGQKANYCNKKEYLVKEYEDAYIYSYSVSGKGTPSCERD